MEAIERNTPIQAPASLSTAEASSLSFDSQDQPLTQWQLEDLYTSKFRKLKIQYTISGAIFGQLISTFWGWSWPLTPIVGILIALFWVHRKYLYAPGDLTDWQIAILKNQDVISPFNYSQIEPDSYDVLLGSNYTRINKGGTEENWTADEVVIMPGECLLAHTIETFRFPHNLKGLLQGKSSWARLSLFVECAGLFDKGFEGTAVLELFNASPNPIRLQKGDKIAQMSFHRTFSSVIPYGSALRKSHYQQQTGAKNSWLTKLNRIVKIERQ
jgi:dCTP deaminase